MSETAVLPAIPNDHFDPMNSTPTNTPLPLTLADPALFANPHAIYDRMRAISPVYWDATAGMYVVTAADEVDQVLRNHADFSSVPDSRIMAFYSNAPEVISLYQDAGAWAPMSTLVTTDPPDHRRYRALVEKAVGASNVRRLRESVLVIVNELIGGFIDDGKVDLQAQVAQRLPLFVICDLLGMPREQAGVLQEMAEATTKLADASLLSPQEILDGHRTQIQGQKVFHEQIERRRAEPSDDLLSQLVHARLPTGEALNEREIHSVIQALLVGGNDTTPGAIGNAMLLLANNEPLQARLRAEPALVPAFAEEALRIESPVAGMFRRTTREVVLGGVTLPANATLAIRFAAANRDAALFERPNDIDLDRKRIRNHFAFGGGIHYCVGNILARMEVAVAIEQLLLRMDSIELDPPDHAVRYVPKLIVRSLQALPVSFRRRS
jgi:cytochrome P450